MSLGRGRKEFGSRREGSREGRSVFLIFFDFCEFIFFDYVGDIFYINIFVWEKFL